LDDETKELLEKRREALEKSHEQAKELKNAYLEAQ
jgi:hypothetical protein